MPGIEAGKSLAGVLLEQMSGLLDDSYVVLEEVNVLLEETVRILEDGENGIERELKLPGIEAAKVWRGILLEQLNGLLEQSSRILED